MDCSTCQYKTYMCSSGQEDCGGILSFILLYVLYACARVDEWARTSPPYSWEHTVHQRMCCHECANVFLSAALLLREHVQS